MSFNTITFKVTDQGLCFVHVSKLKYPVGTNWQGVILFIGIKHSLNEDDPYLDVVVADSGHPISWLGVREELKAIVQNPELTANEIIAAKAALSVVNKRWLKHESECFTHYPTIHTTSGLSNDLALAQQQLMLFHSALEEIKLCVN